MMKEFNCYKQLNGGEKRLYKTIEQTVLEQKTKVLICGKINLKKIFAYVLGDHPEAYYINQYYTLEERLGVCQLRFSYHYEEKERKCIQTELDAFVDGFTKRYIKKGYSDYDKVKTIHDYLTNCVEYDTLASRSDSSRGFEESHTIVGALLRKRAVCSGISMAFKYLCDALGIKCLVVTGTARNECYSGSHAWNIVQINGYCQHIDVTWDNQSAIALGIPNYTYFNVDDVFMRLEHNWNEADYPPCPDDPYNYFRMNECLFGTRKRLEGYLKEQMMTEERQILFKVKAQSELDVLLPEALVEICQAVIRRCSSIRVKTFRYSKINTHRIYMIEPEYV